MDVNASTGADNPLRFGSFELDVRSRELRKGATAAVRLQEQPFEILRMLLERRGDVVTRDELHQRLWPQGTFVDFEHSLNAAVKRLRAALGDDAEHPRFVETLPRRGYRFIGALAGETTRVQATVAAAPRVRMAVLPFTSLSTESDQGYFVDGLTEEMIAQLGQLFRGRIGVISRSSSMMFRDGAQRARDIGQALRVDYLLEGSVRRDGDRVRIIARLVEAVGETDLWVETYDSHLDNCLLTVQKDVAVRIARSLAVELLPDLRGVPEHAPGNPTAYQLYLKGRYYWNLIADQGVEEALLNFEQAVRLDPSMASAQAGLARAHILHAEYYHRVPRQALEAARVSAVRALELQPGFYEGHIALGDVRRMLERDWRGAESAYSQAIVLNPSSESAHRGYALLLAGLSRPAEAIREADRASDVDPLCVAVSASGAAWVRYLAGDCEGAIARARRAVDTEPDYLVAHRVLAAALLRGGRPHEAIAVLESALRSAERDPMLMAWLAHAHAAGGRHDVGWDLVKGLTVSEGVRHVPAYHLAIAYAGLEDLDAAFAALHEAAADADPALGFVAVEPRFELLRSDARFARLKESLALQ